MDIESMNTNALPREVYLRGLIRIYATFLGLDPEVVFGLRRKNDLQTQTIDFDYISLEKTKKAKILTWPYIFHGFLLT